MSYVANGGSCTLSLINHKKSRGWEGRLKLIN